MHIIEKRALSASLGMLVKVLASSKLLQFARHESVLADLEQWEGILLKIQAVTVDAEEKRMRMELVNTWLSKLENLAEEVESIVVEFETQFLKKKLPLEPDEQPSASRFLKLIPTCCAANLSPRISKKLDSIMESRIKEVTARLQDLATQKDQLGLNENSVGKSAKVRRRLPTTSLVDEAKVFGREKDKEEIVELLLRDDLRNEDGFSVIPIIGTEGVGKTTLAQLAYNDIQVQYHFDHKVWVSIPEDFDVVWVTKIILRSITDRPVVDDDFNFLQEELKKKLFGKKFLFVLDGVCKENYNDWTVLSCPFEAGALGSKIVVTTSNQGVVEKMGTFTAYRLKELSNDDCLRVFTQHSLSTRDFSRHQSLKEIGEKIVIKCNGSPLIAKTLGGHLRSKYDPSEWIKVLNGSWQDVEMV